MDWKRLSVVVCLGVVLASLSLVLAQSPTRQADWKIDSQVLADLRDDGEATFFVVLAEQADSSRAAGLADWKLRGEAVVDALQQTSARTQRPILERLADTEADVTPFWIVNAIQVTTSDESLVWELASRADVAAIEANQEWPLPEPIPAPDEPKIQATEWGVARVGAPDVWAQIGVRGEGIVVANIDTGVQFSHAALMYQYRGLQPDGTFNHHYNWHNPSGGCPAGTPCDTNGHGTHTMGTIVGDDWESNQIGVAPWALWIAAKGCGTFGCSTTALLSSGQWMLAPTDLNGRNPRPDLRPHVVNNSWGGGTTSTFYRATVQAWVNAGIFPVFAIGNGGSRCGSANIPGAYPQSFGVGATNISDNIATFSSRGPATAFGGIVKPNVSAPGVSIRSAWNNGSYRTFSGTSMAAPHVTGVVALVWAANPGLIGDVASTAFILEQTAGTRLSTQCGAAGPPNNVYGWGIVDAYTAALASLSPQR